ncbi:MAG: NACHT domain-containing protein [Bacteroidetes bacterium]|nr:NACHT domain-containing protein [Bacteroidota bacterium]
MSDFQVAVELGVDLMKDIVAAGYSFLKEKSKARDFWGAATSKYIGGLLERNSTIKVLTMREPQPLEKLFVRANILKDKITAELGLSAEELEKFHDLDRRTFGKIAETVDGELIVNQLQRFIVLGKPGAGKTTYLRYLTLMMLQPFSQIEQRKLPVFVTLREWADRKKPLMDFIVEQFDICGFEEARPFVERVLGNGDCVVLFDGLDEVSQEANQHGIIQEIKDFSDKYGKNQFIISCRVAAYNRWFERFSDVEMADFNEAQIEQFIRNWFHAEPEVGKECWEKLQKSPQLKELASVPLLLTLLCIVYNRSNNFPPNRANLYEEAIDALLRDWDATRRISRDDVYKQLSITRKKSMFARIAWGTFTENMYFVPERILTKQIEKYIEHLPGFKPEELDVDSQAVLKSIEAQHGIFVERAKKVHSFAHLTFQEYFTAKYIVDNAREGTLERLVNEHLYDDKWKEVFLLVAGMLDNAEELFILMERKNNELLKVKEIKELMVVAEGALLKNKSRYPDIVRRDIAIVITLILEYARSQTRDFIIDLDRFFVHEYASIHTRARAQVLDFDLNRALDLRFNYDQVYDYDFVLGLARAHALDLDLNLDILENYVKVNVFPIEILDQLANFLKAKILILNCLEHDAFVSKNIRERILHDRLMVGEE